MPRFSVDFNEEANKELEDLAEKLQTTKVEVLRYSLGLYGYVVSALYSGQGELALAHGDDVNKAIVVPGVPASVQLQASEGARTKYPREERQRTRREKERTAAGVR